MLEHAVLTSRQEFIEWLARKAPQKMKAQKFTLLIVEDDEDQRFFFQKSFEALGLNYKVQLAASGKEALAYLKGEGKYGDRTKFEFPFNPYGVTSIHYAMWPRRGPGVISLWGHVYWACCPNRTF